jgi:hypothetical protein
MNTLAYLSETSAIKTKIVTLSTVVIVTKLYHLSLLFVCMLLALLTDIRLNWKGIPGTNNLTYYKHCKSYKTVFGRNLRIFVIRPGATLE